MPGDAEGLSICGGFQPEDALLPNSTELSLEIDVSVAWKSAPIRKDQEFKDSDTSQKSQKQPSLVRPGSHAPEIHSLQCEASLLNNGYYGVDCVRKSKQRWKGYVSVRALFHHSEGREGENDRAKAGLPWREGALLLLL